ncbi:MAG: hypothetical protein H6825_01570 [Planctomycetes bacterium]|nr:hypothetical protein [Planctomycetota bacterium]
MHLMYALTAALCGACAPASGASPDREQAPLRAVPGAMRDLVPADTVLYVDAASAEALHALVAACAQIGPTSSVPEARALLTSALPDSIATDLVDPGRPAALALRAVNGHPVPTWILPVSDAEAFAASARAAGMTAETNAGWVSVADEARRDPLAGELTFDPLPGGVIAARIDIPALVAAYRPMIDMAIQNMRTAMATQPTQQAFPGVDMQALTGAYVGLFDTLVTSATRLDLVVRLAGSRITLDGHLELRPDGPLSPFDVREPVDLRALAGTLDSDAMGRVVGRCDMAEAMRRLADFMQIFAAPDVDPETMLAASTRMYSNCTGGTAQSFDFGGDGMRVESWFGSRDPAAFVEAAIGLITSGAYATWPGATWDEPVHESIAGVEATRIVQRLPDATEDDLADPVLHSMRAMAGGDEIAMRYIPLDGGVLTVLGRADVARAVARVRSPGEPSDALADAIEAVGDAGTAWVADIDLSGLLAIGLSQLPPGQRTTMHVPAGRTSLTLWAAGRDDGWDFELALDLDELKAFGAALSGR